MNMLDVTNTILMENASTDDFQKLGFIECYEGVPLEGKQPESVWGISYDMEFEEYEIVIDCSFVVKLFRKDTGEELWVHIPDLEKLKDLIEFAK